jgi:phospholipid/cholesterol/gamma-HCH transport system substrate-binding protein
MENRARYTLMGLFTLGVIFAGFAFTYWLHASGGLIDRASYRVRFDSPVPGLLKGSAVLFNGIRVGEVTNMSFNRDRPNELITDIVIDRATPLRADSRVGIEFQGLSGAPVLSLVGGSPAAPAPRSASGEIPLLIAEQKAGQSLTLAAREVLRRLDTVVADNAAPLRNAIASIDKFSAGLARNSDKLDGIFTGLERLTGGGAKAPPRIYDLAAPKEFPGLGKLPSGQLVIPEPTALILYDSEKILIRGGEDKTNAMGNAQWPDLLPKLLQARIVESFENAKYMKALGRVPEETKADHRLAISLRRFDVATKPNSMAEVEFTAKIIDKDGRLVEARVFRTSERPSDLTPPSAAAALGEAFRRAAVELVVWSCRVIA